MPGSFRVHSFRKGSDRLKHAVAREILTLKATQVADIARGIAREHRITGELEEGIITPKGLPGVVRSTAPYSRAFEFGHLTTPFRKGGEVVKGSGSRVTEPVPFLLRALREVPK